MRLTVIHRAGCRYRGEHHPKGATLVIDETAHGAAASIRYLKALNKVADADPAPALAPAGKVAETQPLFAAAPEPPPPAATPPESAPEVEAGEAAGADAAQLDMTNDPPTTRRRGRGRGAYQTRDLRAED